jgi:hypothetical protein
MLDLPTLVFMPKGRVLPIAIELATTHRLDLIEVGDSRHELVARAQLEGLAALLNTRSKEDHDEQDAP